MSEAKKIEIVDNEASPHVDYVWNKRILIVEDEKEIAKSYEEILSAKSNVVPMIKSSRAKKTEARKSKGPSDGFELVIVHSADDALTEVRKAIHHKKPFAMGFFDVMLGKGKDGFELVKDIHQIDSQIYSVFVTAYNDRSVDSIHSFLGEDKANRWDYLNKPFSKDEILQKARNFVALWNLHEEKAIREEQMASIHEKLLEGERMAAVATMARGMGHEIGNILMQIMGKADISLNKNQTEMKLALEAIVDATTKASEVLDRYKDLSTSVNTDSPKQKTLLLKVLDDAISLMEPQFTRRNIKVCCIKRDNVEIDANSSALLQVLVNLSINSMHVMEKSGQIDFSVTDLGQKVELKVRDYGPGIDKELLEKVTAPFFTTKGDKGTGLGLAICKEIVEIVHRGEFILQNHGMKGLEAIMRFPKVSGVENG